MAVVPEGASVALSLRIVEDHAAAVRARLRAEAAWFLLLYLPHQDHNANAGWARVGV